MVHTLLMVIFVLVAIAMVVLILLQRGAGAQAGSGFGSGASGTVFGSRGAANFLSRSTAWLAAVFFSLSLFMAWQASREAKPTTAAVDAPAKVDLGVMADLPAGADAAKTPATDAPLPAAAPASTAPATPDTVIAPASTTPAPSTPPSEPNKSPGG